MNDEDIVTLKEIAERKRNTFCGFQKMHHISTETTIYPLVYVVATSPYFLLLFFGFHKIICGGDGGSLILVVL